MVILKSSKEELHGFFVLANKVTIKPHLSQVTTLEFLPFAWSPTYRFEYTMSVNHPLYEDGFF